MSPDATPTRMRLAIALGAAGVVGWFATALPWIDYQLVGLSMTTRGYESKGATMWIAGIPGGWLSGAASLLVIAGAVQIGRDVGSTQSRVWGVVAVVAGLTTAILPLLELAHARSDFDRTFTELGIADSLGANHPRFTLGIGGWVTTIAGIAMVIAGVATTVLVGRETPSRWKTPGS